MMDNLGSERRLTVINGGKSLEMRHKKYGEMVAEKEKKDFISKKIVFCLEKLDTLSLPLDDYYKKNRGEGFKFREVVVIEILEILDEIKNDFGKNVSSLYIERDISSIKKNLMSLLYNIESLDKVIDLDTRKSEKEYLVKKIQRRFDMIKNHYLESWGFNKNN